MPSLPDSMRRSILVALASCALGALIWLVSRDFGAAADHSPRPADRASDTTAAQPNLDAPTVDETPQRRASVASEPSVSPARSPVVTSPRAEQDSDSSRARLVGPDGHALADARLELVWRSVHSDRDVDWRHFSGETDDEGRIALERPPFDRPGRSLGLRILAVRGAGPKLASQWIEISEPLARDLGEHRLDVLPPLVAGSVTEPDGTPVSGATIRLERGCADDREVVWNRTTVSATSDAEGRFELYGEAELEPASCTWRFAVTVSEATHARATRHAVELGTREVRLTLARAGSIELAIVAAAISLPFDGTVSISRRDASTPDTLERACTLSSLEPNHFRFARLAPGEWDVHVRSSSGQVLAEVSRVRVPEGATADDRRLEPVQLPALERVALRLHPTEGNRPVDVRVQYVWTEKEGARRSLALRQTGPDAWNWYACSDDDVLLVTHPFLHARRFDHPRGEIEIEAKPPPRVRVEFAGATDVFGQGPGVRLELVRTPWTDLPWNFEFRGVVARPPTAHEFTLETSGEFDLVWIESVAASPDSATRRWIDPRRPRVFVSDHEATQTVLVDVPPDLLERLREAR